MICGYVENTLKGTGRGVKKRIRAIYVHFPFAGFAPGKVALS